MFTRQPGGNISHEATPQLGNISAEAMRHSDLIRKHGISRPTYFNRCAKYGGVSVTELKRMHADLALENSANQGCVESKTVGPFAKRQAAEILVKEHGISIVRAWSVVRLSRTAWYRRLELRIERDRDVIEVLNETVSRKPLWGFWNSTTGCGWTAIGAITSGYIGCIAR